MLCMDDSGSAASNLLRGVMSWNGDGPVQEANRKFESLKVSKDTPTL